VSAPRRAFVVVLDACGMGALPDADAYGDEGTHTLAHLAEALGGLDLPALQRLGLGSIDHLAGVAPATPPQALHGRLHPLGPGKDSTTGHWELMGVVADTPPPTYPDGFPPEVVELVCRLTGRGVLCNQPYNGIAAIDDFGAEHLTTGRLILYTSQDSVLQVAAHATVVPESELHAACQAIRQQLPAQHAVQRVIARPFAGEPGAFERLPGRRDFSLAPPKRSYLDELQDAGVAVHAVGKVDDLFSGRGITEAHAGSTNTVALGETTRLVDELDAGLAFTNLIETDQVYGHRKDLHGFHRALQEIDRAVAAWLPQLRDGDLLVLTADHGVDMTTPGTDHTREYAPLLAVAPGLHGRHDGPLADVGASVLRWLARRDAPDLPGTAFV
jgi:phosphopentomutase